MEPFAHEQWCISAVIGEVFALFQVHHMRCSTGKIHSLALHWNDQWFKLWRDWIVLPFLLWKGQICSKPIILIKLGCCWKGLIWSRLPDRNQWLLPVWWCLVGYASELKSFSLRYIHRNSQSCIHRKSWTLYNVFCRWWDVEIYASQLSEAYIAIHRKSWQKKVVLLLGTSLGRRQYLYFISENLIFYGL